MMGVRICGVWRDRNNGLSNFLVSDQIDLRFVLVTKGLELNGATVVATEHTSNVLAKKPGQLWLP
jgi:hypothetical protein